MHYMFVFVFMLLINTIKAHAEKLLRFHIQRAGCFTLFVFLVSRDCCVALPHDATGMSAVCDCGIS